MLSLIRGSFANRYENIIIYIALIVENKPKTFLIIFAAFREKGRGVPTSRTSEMFCIIIIYCLTR